MNKKKDVQLGDTTLINLAIKYYKAGCYDSNTIRILNNYNGELSNMERNLLLKYLDNFQTAMFKNLKVGLSMRQMRDAILDKCGRSDLINDTGYNNGTVNASQLHAIYNHVMGIKELTNKDND